VEVVLCGIHIGHWGRDLGLELADLLLCLSELEPRGPGGEVLDYRLRLSSIEATEVSDPILDLMAARPQRLAPHLHMPMQSGDDGTLARMNRWYTVSEYLHACERIRARLDRPAFTADVLVGFPGEDGASFERTLETVKLAGFCQIHVFPFSARPGTAAWDLPGRVDPMEVRERRAALSEVAGALARSYRVSLGGLRETVVLEGFAGLIGRYQRVQVDPDHLEGLPRSVEVELDPQVNPEGRVQLWGRPILEPEP
jgi:threonylcarbamoyladenosine tRNA methylthiotransferase MtaB